MPLGIGVPLATEDAASTVLIVHTTGNSTSIRVHFSVAGAYQGIQVSPECNFGDVTVGTTSAACSITITNTGDGTAMFDDVSIDNSVFAPEGVFPVPVMIGSRQSMDFGFVARPLSAGRAFGLLVLRRGTESVEGQSTFRVNGI